MMNYEISKFVKAHPDRLSAFISIQPANAERSIEAVKRARDDGFCGIGEIHDGVQQFEFLSPQFDDICAAAAECELPICVHITESSERKYLGKVPTKTSHAVEAARANPSTNFILPTGAGGKYSAARKLSRTCQTHISTLPQARLQTMTRHGAAQPTLSRKNRIWKRLSAAPLSIKAFRRRNADNCPSGKDVFARRFCSEIFIRKHT